jgi:hypothetical protein
VRCCTILSKSVGLSKSDVEESTGVVRDAKMPSKKKVLLVVVKEVEKG